MDMDFANLIHVNLYCPAQPRLRRRPDEGGLHRSLIHLHPTPRSEANLGHPATHSKATSDIPRPRSEGALGQHQLLHAVQTGGHRVAELVDVTLFTAQEAGDVDVEPVCFDGVEAAVPIPNHGRGDSKAQRLPGGAGQEHKTAVAAALLPHGISKQLRPLQPALGGQDLQAEQVLVAAVALI